MICIFLYCFIMLLHLISSFSLSRSLLFSYAYVSIKSIDCTDLSSLEVKVKLLISSVKTLSFSLLNFWCVFNIKLLLFMKSLRLYTLVLLFFLNNLFYHQVELFLNSFPNFRLYVFLLWYTFSCLFIFDLNN